MKRSPLLALALLIGCATGAAVSQVALAPARAQAEPTPRGWEYTCRDDLQDNRAGVDAALKTFASQRWELVTANQTVTENEKYRWAMCFKRAVY